MISVMLFTACELRVLEDDYVEYALVPVNIDWSISGVSVEEMHRASVWLFPHNGGVPLEYRLEGDLLYREIPVPVGVYSALVFNETIDENDWNNIVFTGTDSYETFAAHSIAQQEIGFYQRSADLPLIGNPEAIAAWSLDRFEITPEMILRNRSLLKNKTALTANVPHLSAVKPLPRFERVVVTAYVTNLASSKQVTGTIDGMYSGVYMASGKRITDASAQAFILNGRVYDGNDGTTTRTFNIFGREPQAKHKISLDFLLTNNELHPREEFDASKLFVTETVAHVRTHTLRIGYGNLDGDHPINLPKGDMDAGISVDEWEEVIIPIK